MRLDILDAAASAGITIDLQENVIGETYTREDLDRQPMPRSLEIVIATGDIVFLASVLRGEVDDDLDVTDTTGVGSGLWPVLSAPVIDNGEVLIEARTSHRHLMGGCDGTLAREIADSLDGTSGVQVPVMVSYSTSGVPKADLIDVAVFFVAERPSAPRC